MDYKNQPSSYTPEQVSLYRPLSPLPNGDSYYRGQTPEEAPHLIAEKINKPNDRLIYLLGYGSVESDDRSRPEMYLELSSYIVNYYDKLMSGQLPGRMPHNMDNLTSKRFIFTKYAQDLRYYKESGDPQWEDWAGEMLMEHWIYMSFYESRRNGLDPAHPELHINMTPERAEEQRVASKKTGHTAFVTMDDYFHTMKQFLSEKNNFQQLVEVMRNPSKTSYCRGVAALGEVSKALQAGEMITRKDTHLRLKDPIESSVADIRIPPLKVLCDRIALVLRKSADAKRANTLLLHTIFPVSPYAR